MSGHSSLLISKSALMVASAAALAFVPAMAQKSTTNTGQANKMASVEAVVQTGTRVNGQPMTYEEARPGEVVPDSACLIDKDNSPEECAERKRANEEQLAASNSQLQQNAASAQQYQERLASYNAQMEVYRNTVGSRDAAQMSYAETKANYERAHAQWEADVAACNAGDKSRCSKVPVAPQ